MTRLFTDGAESGDKLRTNASSSNMSATTSQKRTGNYSYYLPSGTLNSSYYGVDLGVNYTEFYARIAYRIEGFTAGGHLFNWRNSAGTTIGSLQVKSFAPLVIAMYDSTTERVASANLNVLVNEWHVYEVWVKINGAGVGRFRVKLDGSLVCDFTGVTNTAGANVSKFYSFVVGVSADAFIDDIAINDTVGAIDNSWCGDGGVLAALVPITGAAEYADLIASAGDAWDCVNEIPANSTDYVYESTVDKKSTYLLSDLAGLPSGASIARVWVEVDALETAADGDKIATLLRSATTDAQGADQILTLAYARYLSAEYLVDPAGGEDPTWTEAKVNALQAGAVVR